jgi:hypothetical protein
MMSDTIRKIATINIPLFTFALNSRLLSCLTISISAVSNSSALYIDAKKIIRRGLWELRRNNSLTQRILNDEKNIFYKEPTFAQQYTNNTSNSRKIFTRADKTNTPSDPFELKPWHLSWIGWSSLLIFSFCSINIGQELKEGNIRLLKHS